jgi:PAS domain S-box-containing protein
MTTHAQQRIHPTPDTTVDYRQLLDSVTDSAIVMLDPDGRISSWNTGAERITGYAAAEILGQPGTCLYPPEALADGEPARDLQQAARQGRLELDAWRVRQDGTRFWASVAFTALRAGDGTLSGYAQTFRDNTEYREAEEQMRRTTAYTRSLIEASLDPLVTIAPDGKITDVNTATETMTGRTRAELIGTDFSDYFANPALAKAGYQLVFRDGEVRDYPLDLLHRGGGVTPVLYNASVYRDAAGSVVGVFAAARDITERKLAEERIRQQSNEILELSTPVMQVWQGVVVLPLIGTLDSQRSQQFMERLLERIVETNSSVALVDIMGVPTIDTRTAQHLIDTITAARLLGAQVVMTGIRPAIAQTLVHLGVDLSGITTRSSLAAGLTVALELLNLTVVPKTSRP